MYKEQVKVYKGLLDMWVMNKELINNLLKNNLMGIILLGNKQVLLLLIYTGSAVSPLRTALTFRAFTIWSTFTSNFIVAVAIT